MSQNFKPNNFSLLTPSLVVTDVMKSQQLYQAAFGFAMHDSPVEQDGQVVYLSMVKDGAHIMLLLSGAMDTKDMLPPKTSNTNCPIGIYFYVTDVDSFYKNAVANGAIGVLAPEDMFWGDRMCRLQDLDGYNWSFATSKQT